MRGNGTGQGAGQKDEEGGTCGHWIPGLMILGFSPTRREAWPKSAWNVRWDREGLGCAPLFWSRGWGPHPKGATPGLITRGKKQVLPGSQDGVVPLD